MASLSDKVVLVTGAAAGIGQAAARLCSEAGARLILIDRDGVALQERCAELGPDALPITADVGEPSAADQFVRAGLSRFGHIDIAMLNAGMAGTIAPIDKVSADDFDRIMAVNVRSVWSAMAALFPAMKAAGGGSIVVTASTGGLSGAPMVSPYIASKHAVIGLVKAAALEGARHGIRVNAVAPSPIATEMMVQINRGLGTGDEAKSRARTIAHVPMQRYGTAEEVAKVMVFLAGGDASFTTGSTYVVDGGMTAGVYP